MSGIVDTHCHAWDTRCAYVAGTAYLPHEAMPLETLLAQWNAHDVSWGVLVQPSFLGSDNHYLLTALGLHPDRLRGVIVAEPERDLARIDALHRSGVRGFRFNLISAGPLPELDGHAWREWIAAAKQHGWHVVIAGSSRQLAESLPRLAETGLPIVVDHWGLPDPRAGAADTHWHRCLDLARHDSIWFKLSAPYRLGGLRMEHLLPEIADAVGPERLLWGSDWPCTRHETCRDYAELRRLPTLPGHDAQPLLRRCATNAATLYLT